MSEANQRQVGGDHYRKVPGEQHWDRVARLDLDYFQGNITAYVERWKDKNGLEDLVKARHYLDKYIEIEKAKQDAEDAESLTLFTSRVVVIGPRCANCRHLAEFNTPEGMYCHQHLDLRSKDEAAADDTNYALDSGLSDEAVENPLLSPSRHADDAPNYTHAQAESNYAREREEATSNSPPDGSLRAAIAEVKCILCGAAAGSPHLPGCDRAYDPPLVIERPTEATLCR